MEEIKEADQRENGERNKKTRIQVTEETDTNEKI